MGEFVRTAGVSVWAAIEALWQVLEQVPWTVLGDIGMMTFLVYQVYVRFRGTRAARVVGGIIVLGLGGLAAQEAGLFLTAWFLGGIGAAALIFVLIIFQSEIRDMLEQVNPWLPAQLFLNRIGQGRPSEELLVTLTESIFSMAKKHCGALLVFERGTTLEPFLRSPGTLLNAELSPELIETVFTPPTPLHDGALYIQQGRAHRAGCVLPLSDNRRLASYYGTRHRAALGITEKTDALAVVVSEERGTVSVTEQGALTVIHTPEALLSWLTQRLRAPRTHLQQRRLTLALLTANWRPKLATLIVVGLLWFVLVGRQDTELGFSIPIVYTNVPTGLTLQQPEAQQVYVSVRGSREMLNFVDPSRLRVSVNLTGVGPGRQQYVLDPKDINLPPGLQVIGLNPAKIWFRLGEQPQETNGGQKAK